MKKINTIIILSFLNGLMIFSSESEVLVQDANEHQLQNDAEKGMPIDTTKVLFFLDGERASAKATLGKLSTDSVQYVKGSGSSKVAIFRFGEKARNGLLIFKSAEKK